MLIDDIREQDRLMLILHDRLLADSRYEEQLFREIDSFSQAYLDFHDLEAKVAIKDYKTFIKAYNKDLKKFASTGKFPLELDPEREGPGRIPYNIILLFSCLLNPHRFRIMQLIKEKAEKADLGLFIGCGPGLEMSLTSSYLEKTIAYDLVLDDFLQQQFSEIEFRNSYFDGSDEERYGAVYLIEILEHLEQPYALLEDCKKVLNPGGHIYLTTATDIPQFDHLYNFPKDHSGFEKKLVEMGLEVVYKEEILHQALTQEGGAQNVFYKLKSN